MSFFSLFKTKAASVHLPHPSTVVTDVPTNVAFQGKMNSTTARGSLSVWNMSGELKGKMYVHCQERTVRSLARHLSLHDMWPQAVHVSLRVSVCDMVRCNIASWASGAQSSPVLKRNLSPESTLTDTEKHSCGLRVVKAALGCVWMNPRSRVHHCSSFLSCCRVTFSDLSGWLHEFPSQLSQGFHSSNFRGARECRAGIWCQPLKIRSSLQPWH